MKFIVNLENRFLLEIAVQLIFRFKCFAIKEKHFQYERCVSAQEISLKNLNSFFCSSLIPLLKIINVHYEKIVSKNLTMTAVGSVQECSYFVT